MNVILKIGYKEITFKDVCQNDFLILANLLLNVETTDEIAFKLEKK